MLKDLFLATVACVALVPVCPSAAKVRIHDDAIFADFEIVDCHQSGSKAVVLQSKNGQPETYCIASEPIITRMHLKSSEVCNDGKGRPELELALTQEGAQLMEKATTRILAQHTASGGRAQIAVFINKKLVSAPFLHDVIRDRFVWQGFSQKEVEAMADALGGSKHCSSINIEDLPK